MHQITWDFVKCASIDSGIHGRFKWLNSSNAHSKHWIYNQIHKCLNFVVQCSIDMRSKMTMQSTLSVYIHFNIKYQYSVKCIHFILYDIQRHFQWKYFGGNSIIFTVGYAITGIDQSNLLVKLYVWNRNGQFWNFIILNASGLQIIESQLRNAKHQEEKLSI